MDRIPGIPPTPMALAVVPVATQTTAAMPEPNRKLVDFMYEAAWHILFEYRYGYPQDKVPAPWYDCLGNTAATEHHTKPAAPAEFTELTAPAETHKEDRDGESGC